MLCPDFAGPVIGPATSAGPLARSGLRLDWWPLLFSNGTPDIFGPKLRLHRVGKGAAALQELVVGSGFDDPAVIEHQNTRRIADGCKPVRDDERSAAFHHLVECRGDARLGHRV